MRRGAGLALALGALAVLGVAAAVDGGLTAASLGLGRQGAVHAAAALVGAGAAVYGVAWLAASFGKGVSRRIRGSRTARAYFAWMLWSAAFFALSYRAAGELGRPAGLALAALTLSAVISRLDILPRLVAGERGIRGPGLPALGYQQLEAFELCQGPAPGMACLRLQARGEPRPLEVWVAPPEVAPLRRLLTSQKLAERALPGPPPRPPLL